MKLWHALLPLALFRCEAGAPHREATVEVVVEPPLASAGPTASSVSVEGEAFSFRRFRFDLAKVKLAIVDIGMTGDLGQWVHDKRATLVTNGGFFGVKNEPIGLARSSGKELSAFSSTMSGGVLVVEEGRASLIATEDYDKKKRKPDFAVQCRPRLVVEGKLNIKRDDGRRSERTALCVRDEGRTLEVIIAKNEITGPSLFALGRHLVGLGCEEALNLDGGPSTGIAWREGDRVYDEPPTGPIRHAILVSE